MRASHLAFACLAVRCSRFAERKQNFTATFAGVDEQAGEQAAGSGVGAPARKILILDPACSGCLNVRQTVRCAAIQIDIIRLFQLYNLCCTVDCCAIAAYDQLIQSVIYSSLHLPLPMLRMKQCHAIYHPYEHNTRESPWAR